MSSAPAFDRFEELEAGRILGDLDSEEAREWQQLNEALQKGPDQSLELVAAALETSFLVQNSEALPAEFEAHLKNTVTSASPSS